MKNINYQTPEFLITEFAIERGFADTTNVEDPVEKPEKDW